MVAPVLETLQITDGRQGKADVPVVRSRVFQLTVEYVSSPYIFIYIELPADICVFYFRIFPCKQYLYIDIVCLIRGLPNLLYRLRLARGLLELQGSWIVL